MANKEYLDILHQGAEVWNKWRESNPDLKYLDLRGAGLAKARLTGINLSGTDLVEAHLSWANLSGANLAGANLSGANLIEANLWGSRLCGANLSWANLHRADLSESNLSGALFHRTCLTFVTLIDAHVEKAILTDCHIHGISVWGLIGEPIEQSNLIITPREGQLWIDQSHDEPIAEVYNGPIITVDNLEVAQFIHLLLNNKKIRQVIDTITGKVVLILGRFTPERKAVLDAIREELRRRGWLPVLFDFEGPTSRDVTETVSVLAHMARFIIADITEAKSIPQELQAIIPHLPSVPVQPLLESTNTEYGMFEHFKRYPWVLPVYRYEDQATLLASLGKSIITPAEEKVKELQLR